MQVTKQFVTAGKAMFTLELPDDYWNQYNLKPHYTFRVNHKPARGAYKEAYFVSMLTGSDNTRDFTYLGILNKESGRVRTTEKSFLTQDNRIVRLLNRSLKLVWSGDDTPLMVAGFYLHHEGRCGRCSRALSTPMSITLGVGPECLSYFPELLALKNTLSGKGTSFNVDAVEFYGERP